MSIESAVQKVAQNMKISLEPPVPQAFLGREDHDRLEAAERAGTLLATRLDRAGRGVRECPVRIEFIRRASLEEAVPPMVRMLGQGGGRGGEVRLKLYLSLLWASPGSDHNTNFIAADWAQLLGLSQPSRKGKRRIYDALAWLEGHHFVSVDRRKGMSSVVTVLRESGNGSDYDKPSEGVEAGGEPSYRRLQPTWWTNGWIAGLSGRALVFWLVLMDETGNGARTGPIWLSESQTKNKYAISPHLRQHALRELKAHHLIEARRKMANEPFGRRSSRTEIVVKQKRLNKELSKRVITPGFATRG